MDYKFGNKNNWRRWAWNQIKKRSNSTSKEIVLYLADEHDYDRPVALSKGFKQQNLIAVNKDKHICDFLREQKKIAICGDLAGILLSWNNQSPTQPTVILADLCGNLASTLAILDATCLHSKHKKILLLNMFRGRENGFVNQAVKAVQTKWGDDETAPRSAVISVIFYSLLVIVLFGDIPSENLTETHHELITHLLKTEFTPILFSYKSSNGSMMDSIAITIPAWFHTTDFMFGKYINKNTWNGLTSYKRQVAANLAVRTMRMEHTL